MPDNTPEQVIEHYRERFDFEKSQLIGMLEGDVDIPSVKIGRGSLVSILHNVDSKGWAFHHDMFSREEPLPSHYLIRQIYQERNHTNDSKVIRFLHEVLLPLSGVNVELNKTDEWNASVNRSIFADCQASERNFLASILESSRACLSNQNRPVNVVVDDSDNPVAIQKPFKENSGLTIKDLVMDGMIVPAGSLIGLGSSTTKEDTQPSDYPVGIRSLNDYQYVEPIRPTPFAYQSVIDRQMFAINMENGQPEYEKYRGSYLGAYNLDDFRAAAATMMQIGSRELHDIKEA